MWRFIASVVLAAAVLPAHAGYIYELSGHIGAIGDAAQVPDVLHVGDTFRATITYESTPGGATTTGICTDYASLSYSFFDFGHTTISNNGLGGGGCMLSGDGAFFSPLYGTGPLEGWATIDAPWRMPVGSDVFPDDISDELWKSLMFELRLFGPYPSSVVQYYVVFDSVISRTVPEPASLALLSMGLLGVAGARRRRSFGAAHRQS